MDCHGNVHGNLFSSYWKTLSENADGGVNSQLNCFVLRNFNIATSVTSEVPCGNHLHIGV
jgi:hypothetical protein